MRLSLCLLQYNRILTCLLIAVFAVIVCQNVSVAAINSVTCTNTYEDPPGSPFKRVFKSSCVINITQGPYSGMWLTARAASSTTNSISGNGSDINYTTKSRFKVQGPAQSSPVDIPVEPGYVKLHNQVPNSTYNVNVDFYYTTYEADCGGTVYSQEFKIASYNSGLDKLYDGPLRSMTFTIPNKAYISFLGSPTIAYTNSADVFTPTFSNESNTVTASVKANNTWTMQVKHHRAPKDDSTLLELPIANNYYKASGSGFINLASSFTAFSAANTYFNAAQNSSGVYTTGSSDGESLNPVDVTFTYKLENNSNIYSKSTYTSNLYYNIVGSWD